jgi:hypothetical protein
MERVCQIATGGRGRGGVDWVAVTAGRCGPSGGDDREDDAVTGHGGDDRVTWTQWR